MDYHLDKILRRSCLVYMPETIQCIRCITYLSVRTRFEFLTQGMNGLRPKKLKTMNL